jgi:hypothetical protein
LAAELIAIDKSAKSLDSKQSEVRKRVDLISHPNLKGYLLKRISGNNPGQAAADALKEWLRVSIKNSLRRAAMYEHPADAARKKDLEMFASGSSAAIPAVVGIKRIFPERAGNVDLCRADSRSGGISHRYLTYPSNVAYILVYPKTKKSTVDRTKPVILEVRQSGEVRVKTGGRYFKDTSKSLIQGKIFGDKECRNDCIFDSREWHERLRNALAGHDFAEYGVITQGTVLQYSDGESHFVRNFSADYGFKTSVLKNVVGVKKTPFKNQFEELLTLAQQSS